MNKKTFPVGVIACTTHATPPTEETFEERLELLMFLTSDIAQIFDVDIICEPGLADAAIAWVRMQHPRLSMLLPLGAKTTLAEWIRAAEQQLGATELEVAPYPAESWAILQDSLKK